MADQTTIVTVKIRGTRLTKVDEFQVPVDCEVKNLHGYLGAKGGKYYCVHDAHSFATADDRAAWAMFKLGM